MSIMERMRELESYDDNSLIEMITNGNPRYPQYAVLGEIQRREDLRRITKNQIARQNQPNMTVADRKVMEFSQGAMPMNPVNTVYNQAEPSATPTGLGSVAPTLMREGGLTQMQAGKQTKVKPSYSDLASQLSESELNMVNQAVMKDRTARMTSDLGKTGRVLGGGVNLSEQALSFLGGSGGNVPIFAGSPEEKKFIEVASNILANRNKKIATMKKGGLTQMQEGERTSLEESFDNPIFLQPDPMMMGMTSQMSMGQDLGSNEFLRSIGVIDEEGNVDPVQAGLVGLSAIPVVRTTGAVLGGLAKVGNKLGLGKLATKIGEKTKDLFTRRPEFVTTRSGKVVSTSTPQGKFAKTMQKNPKITYGNRVFSPSQTLSTVGGVALPAAIIRGLPESVGNLTGTADPQFEQVAFEGNMPMQKQPNQLTGLDQAMIGFSILASNNMTELGANMINVLQSIQARGGTDADKAQVDYLKSRTDLIRKEIANYDSTQLQTEITAVNKAIETMEETGGSPAEITGARTYLDALIKELAEKRNISIEQSFAGGAREE